MKENKFSILKQGKMFLFLQDLFILETMKFLDFKLILESPLDHTRYFIWGEEEYIKTRLVKSIVKKGVPEGLGEFNLDVIYADEISDLRSITDAILAYPVMAERRVVVVHNIDTLSPMAKKRMMGFSFPNTSLVVFTAGDMKMTSSFFKWLSDNFYTLDARPVYESEIWEWVINLAREKGMRLNRSLAVRVVSRTGLNLSVIDHELDKLALFAEDRPLTASLIDEVVAVSREAQIFKFLDALGAKDLLGAVAHLRTLLSYNEKAGQVIYITSRYFLQLITLYLMRATGASTREIKQLGIYYIGKKYEMLNNFKIKELYEVFKLLYEMDHSLKSGLISDQDALYKLVLGVCKK